MPINVLGTELAEIAAESVTNSFDAVIVGGGSAGLTAARTLAENGKRVAVVEAGSAPFLTHLTNTEIRFSRDLTRSVRSGVQYSPKTQTGEIFGKNYSCLGGRGLFWNGSAPRFQEHDFENWPFAISELAQHYEWAERQFRVTRALGESALAQRLIEKLRKGGFNAQPGPFALDADPIRDGHLSAGIASVLAPFFRSAGEHLASGRIRLAIDSQARRINLTGDKARGITATGTGSDAHHEIHAECVLIAGGGVESVRLAALSEVPDPNALIGKGIQDHIFFRSYFEGPHIYGEGGPETAALHVPSASQQTEQWELQAPGRLMFNMDEGFKWNPGTTPEYRVMVRSFCATEKRSSNCVNSAEGPLGAATMHFEYSDADRASMERMQEQAGKIGEATGLTLVDSQVEGPGASYHEAGGLDMGSESQQSVTDHEGRFHSVPNLICVDAASFPRIGATNPHLTIVAESRRKALALLARM